MATSITITSLTATETSISMQCNVISQYTASGLYVRMRLNGYEYKDSSTFSLSAGGSRVVSITMYGLDPDTYYQVEAILYNTSGQVVKDSDYIYTDAASYPPVDYGSISIRDIGSDYVEIRLSSIEYATSYVITYRENGGSPISVRTTTLSNTIQGLRPGTTYTINYYGQNDDGTGPYMPSGVTFTTLSPPTSYGDLTVTDVTANSITVSLTRISGATYYLIAYRPSSSSSQQEVSTSGTTYTITGLQPKTTYYLNYRGANNDGTGPYMPASVTATTLPSVVAWDWNISNGSATATQTKTAYAAVTQKGKLSDFSYLVWNDIVEKTNTVLMARNLTWDNTYGTKSNTVMSSASKAMTAARFNAVWWNLSRMVTVGLGPNPRVPGEVILGSYFTALTNAINKAIP